MQPFVLFLAHMLVIVREQKLRDITTRLPPAPLYLLALPFVCAVSLPVAWMVGHAHLDWTKSASKMNLKADDIQPGDMLEPRV